MPMKKNDMGLNLFWPVYLPASDVQLLMATKNEKVYQTSNAKTLNYRSIGVAPIKQLRTCVIKISNIQGRPPNVVKVIFHTKRNCS